MYAIKKTKEDLYLARDGEWKDLSEAQTKWFEHYLSAEQYRAKNIPSYVECDVTTSHNILMALIWDKRIKIQTVVSNGGGNDPRIDGDTSPPPMG